MEWKEGFTIAATDHYECVKTGTLWKMRGASFPENEVTLSRWNDPHFLWVGTTQDLSTAFRKCNKKGDR